jgi:uroporphyrinogen decarboxylase
MPVLSDYLKKVDERLTRPPVWLMRQAGRYLPEYREVRKAHPDFLGFCFHVEDAARVTLQPIARYDLDAAIIFSDILVVPLALGQKVWFEPGEGPRLDALKGLGDIREKIDLEKLRPVYDAIGTVRKELDANKTLIGFAGAPWTLASYMLEGKTARDYAEARRIAISSPELMSGLIDRLTDAVSLHLIEQARAGADVLMMFDSWAGVLDAKAFEEWSVKPARRIVERVKAAFPDIAMIGFPRGAGTGYRAYAEMVGVDAMAVDSSVSVSELIALQERVITQGNVDNLRLAYDLPGALAQLDAVLTQSKPGQLVVNLGHGVIPQTPPEHVAELVKRVKAFAG